MKKLTIHHWLTLCLVSWLFLAFSAWAQDSAGRLMFVHGQVWIERNSETLAATRGAEIFAGDTLITEAASSAQVRFTDGSTNALRPNTKFTLQDYANDLSNPSNSRKSAELVRGGLRSISGTIGRAAPENVNYDTPVATMGIRGTSFVAVHNDQGTHLLVEAGAVSIQSGTGLRIGRAGQAFRVANRNAVPSRIPANAPVFTEESGEAPADEADEDGDGQDRNPSGVTDKASDEEADGQTDSQQSTPATEEAFQELERIEPTETQTEQSSVVTEITSLTDVVAIEANTVNNLADHLREDELDSIQSLPAPTEPESPPSSGVNGDAATPELEVGEPGETMPISPGSFLVAGFTMLDAEHATQPALLKFDDGLMVIGYDNGWHVAKPIFSVDSYYSTIYDSEDVPVAFVDWGFWEEGYYIDGEGALDSSNPALSQNFHYLLSEDYFDGDLSLVLQGEAITFYLLPDTSYLTRINSGTTERISLESGLIELFPNPGGINVLVDLDFGAALGSLTGQDQLSDITSVSGLSLDLEKPEGISQSLIGGSFKGLFLGAGAEGLGAWLNVEHIDEGSAFRGTAVFQRNW